MITESISTIAILITTYILSHAIRFLLRKKNVSFCAKCSSLLTTSIIIIILNYEWKIITTLIGSLITILAYYSDDYLVSKRKIDFIGQDFTILLVFVSIVLLVIGL